MSRTDATPMIRPEQPTDAAGIRDVHCASFPTDAEARLVAELRASGRLTISLIAESEGYIVGHVAFSPVSTAAGQAGLGLAPLAVHPDHRNQGIAAKLVRNGLDTCRAAGIGWVVVLGEPDYYSRFGFQAASNFGLSDAYGGGPAFQVLGLQPGAVPTNGGLVCYVPEFAVFE